MKNPRDTMEDLGAYLEERGMKYYVLLDHKYDESSSETTMVMKMPHDKEQFMCLAQDVMEQFEWEAKNRSE